MTSRKNFILISSLIIIALLSALVFLFINNSSDSLSSDTVYTLTLSMEELEITDKQARPVLTAKLTPDNKNAVLEYFSSNSSIITFDEREL